MKILTTKELEEYHQAKKTVFRYEQNQRQDPDNCFQYNINDHVLIKLKEEGFAEWFNSYEGVTPKFRPTMEELRSKADEEGYIEFVMWEFMRIFGHKISFGIRTQFFTTIRFYKKDIVQAVKKHEKEEESK